jgi:predicted Zn-dependent protease
MRVFLAHEVSVSERSLEAIEFGVELIGAQLPRLGGLQVEPEPINEDELAMLNPTQVDGDALLNSVPNWPETGVLAVAIAQDLGHKQTNFLFGLSKFEAGKAIFSTFRLEDSPVALAGLVAHELGHVFGLVGQHKPNYDRISQFAGHCVNPCLMQPVNTKEEMIVAANMVADRPAQSGFCDDCTGHLRQVHIAS